MTSHNLLENDDVLRFFVADKTLVSASVNELRVFEISESLSVDVDVTLLYSKKEKKYRIRFEDVVEYEFYHHNNRYFYYIVNLKFFKEGNFYYISLDPDDSINTRSEDDNNFILSSKIQAFSLDT